MAAYDKQINREILLDLQFREYDGAIAHDWAKPYHGPATLTGAPTWQVLSNDLTYLDFNLANPDRIIIAAAASTGLDFTTGAFSGAVWIRPDAYGNRYLMDKSNASTVGWSFWINAVTPYIALSTYNAGPAIQTTYGAAALVLSAWQLVSFTRSGATVVIFLNGRPATVTAAAHIDPASAAAIDFTIGTIVGAGAGWYDGDMWRPRVWNRALTAWEMAAIFAKERELFGV